MVDFKAKIYKRDKLVGESKGDFIEFYDIYIDWNVKNVSWTRDSVYDKE